MRPTLTWPATVPPSLLAALTTWVALWAWSGFLQSPSLLLEPALVGVLLVAVTGIGLRSLRLPVLLTPLVQVAVVAGWLSHRWAADAAFLGWVPTPGSLRVVGETVAAGGTAAQTYTAPVADDVPELVALLLVAGLGVALLVDLLACGLRRVPAAGLPLLAVYTAPASILAAGMPWWTFAAGAAAFLALVAVDHGHRLVQWGRHVPPEAAAGHGARLASTRRSAPTIAVVATGLAVLAPLAVPTMTNSLVLGPGRGGGGDGGSVSITNPVVDLLRNLDRGRDIDLVRVSTTADPAYLRLSVLDTFDGETWRPSARDIPSENIADGRLPRPPGLDRGVPRSERDWSLSVTDAFDSTWLPTPYPAVSVDTPGDWRYDESTLDLVSALEDQTTAGLEYSLVGLEVTPTAQELVSASAAPESVFTPYTDLPEDMPEEVSELARDLTDGLGSRFEKAVRLQRWFREDGGFQYSLERDPGNGSDDLVAFLDPAGRVGYCEQFAAAMAVMGRYLGIPSRVAVGFLRPDQLGPDEYVFSAHDLHAWPEMYFEGTGWVRFEPTPQDRATGVPSYTTGDVSAPQPTDGPSASAPSAQPTQAPSRRPDTEDAAGAAGGDGSDGGTPWGLVLTALLIVALAVTPRLARAVTARRRWADATTPPRAAEAGWAELRDVALDLGLPWSETVTLRTRARELAAELAAPGAGEYETHDRGRTRGPSAAPEAAAALDRVVGDLERARFASGAAQGRGRSREAVVADVALCAEALRSGVSKKRRRRARWLPASLVTNGWWRRLGSGQGVRSRTLDLVTDAVGDRTP